MYIKPKKALAQHFLIDQNIQRKIISASELTEDDFVIEIGAGRGELTELIAERVSRVFAIEIDSRLCQFLKYKFRYYPNVETINGNILKINFKKIFGRLKQKKIRLKVIGNIPYYITTPIIEHLLKFRKEINSIFITVQKEFAKRMVALPGSKDYGSFSCFVQYYTDPEIIFLIKKSSFLPSPKVDSCFLRLDIKKRPSLKIKDERLFFKIIRTAFQQRRKILKNSLRMIIPQEKLEIFFKKYNIGPQIRPEDLSLQDFTNLIKIPDASLINVTGEKRRNRYRDHRFFRA